MPPVWVLHACAPRKRSGILEASIPSPRARLARTFAEHDVPTVAKILNDVHEILSSSAVMVRSAIHGCQGEKPPRVASRMRCASRIRWGRSNPHRVYDTGGDTSFGRSFTSLAQQPRTLVFPRRLALLLSRAGAVPSASPTTTGLSPTRRERIEERHRRLDARRDGRARVAAESRCRGHESPEEREAAWSRRLTHFEALD
jgi:hypothetical protein